MKRTPKEVIQGILLSFLLPIFFLMFAGYLLGSGSRWAGITVTVLGLAAFLWSQYRTGKGAKFTGQGRLSRLDGERMTASEQRQFMPRHMFIPNVTYCVEKVTTWRDTNIVIVQEEDRPVGSFDSVRVFTTKRPISPRLRFFIKRDEKGRPMWDFEPVGSDQAAPPLHTMRFVLY